MRANLPGWSASVTQSLVYQSQLSDSGAAFTTSPGSGCSVFWLLVLQDSPLAVFGRDLRNEEIVPSSF